MDKFDNKTVVITGASQGIGEAAARMFAELDANVILLARSKDKIEKIVNNEIASDEALKFDSDFKNYTSFILI